MLAFTYFGYNVYRNPGGNPSALRYNCLGDYGLLASDTQQGMRELIRDMVKGKRG